MDLQLAAHYNQCIFQMGVKSHFLNGDFIEENYMAKPPAFKISGQHSIIYRLNKNLYGLKQVPKALYDKLDSFFLSLGFQQCSAYRNSYVISQDRFICLDIIYR